MKTIIKLFILLMSTVSFCQSTAIKGNSQLEDVKLNDFKISVSVTNIEDVKSTFDVSDLKKLLKIIEPNQSLQFKIICKGEDKIVGESSTLTYSVKGNSNDGDLFLKQIKKVKKAAIKYYKNKS